MGDMTVDELKDKKFFHLSDNGYEKNIQAYFKKIGKER